jgi:hypothetical protein
VAWGVGGKNCTYAKHIQTLVIIPQTIWYHLFLCSIYIVLGILSNVEMT